MQIRTQIIAIYAFSIFKHVWSFMVKSSMPNPFFKAIKVNCLFYLSCGTIKNKKLRKKNSGPDLITGTGDL